MVSCLKPVSVEVYETLSKNMTGTPPLKLYHICDFFGLCSSGVLVVQNFVSFVHFLLFVMKTSNIQFHPTTVSFMKI